MRIPMVMRKWIAGFALGLFQFALSQASFAFVDAPVLVPPNPMAGQLLSVSVTSGVCDAFAANPPPSVTRVGNSVRINLSAVHQSGDFCVFPPGASVFPVDTFQEGAYTLQVDRTYTGFFGATTETLGIIPFGVAAIAPVPIFDLIGMIGLIALVLLASTMNIAGLRNEKIGRKPR